MPGKANYAPANAAPAKPPRPKSPATEKRISPASKSESNASRIETVGDLSLVKNFGCARVSGAVLAANKYTARIGGVTAEHGSTGVPPVSHAQDARATSN